MKRREKLENKLQKRLDWAEGRQVKADNLHNQASAYRHDWAFITQPGHIPERARMNKRDEKAAEHTQMANHHASKADGLERQLKESIFSDDDDAIEAIQARIKANEDTRARMREANRLYRKGDAEGLKKLGFDLDRLRVEIAERYSWERKGPYRPYELSNLGGRIAADKKRLKHIAILAERREKADEAGGVTIEDFQGSCVITFAEKPDYSIIKALKAANFYWNGGSWCGTTANIPEEVRS